MVLSSRHLTGFPAKHAAFAVQAAGHGKRGGGCRAKLPPLYFVAFVVVVFVFPAAVRANARASGSGEFGKGLLADRLFLSLRALFFPLFLPVAAAVLVTASGRLGREWAPYAL